MTPVGSARRPRRLAYGLACWTLLCCSSVAMAANGVLDELAAKYEVRILYEFDHASYFADTLLERNCTEELTAADPELSNLDLVRDTVAQFLDRYPKKLLSESLKTLHLLRGLSCNHVPYGGTVSEKGLYIEVYSYTSRNWLADALHHEFSSMLWRNRSYGFDKVAFERVSGAEAYSIAIEQECLKKSNCRGDPTDKLHRQGFLAKYASTTLENDFNVYAEYLFVHHADLVKLAARYPLIRKKFEMVQAFYGKLGVKF